MSSLELDALVLPNKLGTCTVDAVVLVVFVLECNFLVFELPAVLETELLSECGVCVFRFFIDTVLLLLLFPLPNKVPGVLFWRVFALALALMLVLTFVLVLRLEFEFEDFILSDDIRLYSFLRCCFESLSSLQLLPFDISTTAEKSVFVSLLSRSNFRLINLQLIFSSRFPF